MRYHVFFSGSVQGVGFRYTTQDLANARGLTGWVKNTADGRVEMEVQGSKNEIDKLLNELKNSFAENIRAIDAQELSTEKEYNGFQIKF